MTPIQVVNYAKCFELNRFKLNSRTLRLKLIHPTTRYLGKPTQPRDLSGNKLKYQSSNQDEQLRKRAKKKRERETLAGCSSMSMERWNRRFKMVYSQAQAKNLSFQSSLEQIDTITIDYSVKISSFFSFFFLVIDRGGLWVLFLWSEASWDWHQDSDKSFTLML